MKSILQFSFFGLTLAFVLSACTMEKRVYRSGYHVNWKSNKQKSDKPELVAKLNSKPNIEAKKELVTVSPSEKKTVSFDFADATLMSASPKSKSEKRNSIHNFFSIEGDCDIITLKTGEVIEAKVLEIGTSEIKYKRCNNLEGPIITLRKVKLVSIEYPNGAKDIFSKSPNTPREEAVPNESTESDTSKNTSPYIPPGNSNDRSILVTLLLWAFLGVIGIHRFYLGHIGIGILYLITFGLCGIGWLIDGVLLLTGDLRPRRGEYYDSL